MKKLLLVASAWLLLGAPLAAQVIWLAPDPAYTDDDVTLYFDATQGNGALAGHDGPIFAHTGVITTQSANLNDWKLVVSDWGENDPELMLDSVDVNLYSLSFNIRELYGITDEQVLKLAFLFKDESHTIIARDANNQDMYVDINLQAGGTLVGYTFEAPRLSVQTQNGLLGVECFAPDVFKVSFFPEGQWKADSSYFVAGGADPTLSPSLVETPEHLSLTLGPNEVRVAKDPVRLSFWRDGQLVAREELGVYQQFGQGGVRLEAGPDEHFHGTGSRAIELDLRGKRLHVYNQAHYGYTWGQSALNITTPFYVSTQGYAVLFDSHQEAFLDLAASNQQRVDFNTRDSIIDYYFFFGADFDDLLAGHNQLTGAQPLPPKWALGFIQSRYGYQDEEHARSIVSQLQEAGVPLDALVLDLFWFGTANDMGDLRWDESLWPNHQQMVADFDQAGVKTILITEPYFTTSSDNYPTLSQQGLLATTQDGSPFVIGGFWAGSAGLIDFSQPEAGEWMWPFYRDLIEEGVAGFWSDLGEPENHPEAMWHQMGPAKQVHNVFSLLWAEFMYENFRQEYPDRRFFNLIRSGNVGMQRYGTFPWSGDIQRSFDGLRAQVPILLNMSMSGIPYMHSDLGGFTGGGQNNELYARWIQLGAFSPVMRAHGHDVPPEPIFYPEPYRTIAIDHIKMRYHWLPYNYTLAWQNSTTGRPFALPTHYFEPQNQALANVGDQYLWGEDVLVAPILAEGQTQRPVSFPLGVWFDLRDDQRYQGGATFNVAAPLAEIPVFARAGAFLPMAHDIDNTADYDGQILIVHYFPDSSRPQSQFTLYEDDGHSFDALAAQSHNLVHFEGRVQEAGIQVQLRQEGNGFANDADERDMFFQVHNTPASPEQVRLDGQPVPLVSTLAQFHSQLTAAFWDAERDLLHVRFRWQTAQPATLETDGYLSSAPALAPQAFVLEAPRPNPSDGFAQVGLRFNRAGQYRLELFNLMGQRLWLEEIAVAGQEDRVWQWMGQDQAGAPLPAGQYLLRLTGNGQAASQRLSLIR